MLAGRERTEGASFLLLGASLLALLPARPARPRRLFGRAAAAAAGALGAAALVDSLLGPPPRPCLFGFLGTVFASGALLALDVRPGRLGRPGDLLALCALALGGLTAAGRAFGLTHPHALPSLGPVLGMPLPAASGLVALAFGALAARPQAGLAAIVASERAGGVAARRLLAGALLVVPLLGLLALLGERAGLYPEPGAAVLTMLCALVVVVASALRTARVLDVSELRRAQLQEEARRLGEARERTRFSLALESAASAMVLVDRAGRIAFANGQAERLFGRSLADLRGKPVEVLIPPRSQAAHPAMCERFFTEKAAHRPMGAGRDLFALRGDGIEFPVEIGLTQIEMDEGVFVAASIVDITERKRAQAELEAFTHTVSHDLRAPLRAVQGYADLLGARLKDALDPESRRLLERIGASAVRLDRLIRDLLSFAAVSHEAPALEPVSLDEVVTHVIETYPDMGGRRLRVSAPLGQVMGQPSLLIQAVSNLLSNAVKFVPKDREARVEVRAEDLDGGWTRLVIEDNGIGVPADLQDKLFKPFERLQPRGGYEGTGMGLAIVKRAVERMGGQAGLDSTPGQGSRFWIVLRRPR